MRRTQHNSARTVALGSNFVVRRFDGDASVHGGCSCARGVRDGDRVGKLPKPMIVVEIELKLWAARDAHTARGDDDTALCLSTGARVQPRSFIVREGERGPVWMRARILGVFGNED